MIQKTIKKYKKGNGFRYEISINKKDLEDLNDTKKVNILSNKEYESLNNKIKDSEQTIAKQDKEIKQVYEKLNNIEKNNKNIKELERSYHETIKEITREQSKTIKELNKEQVDYLKQIYDEFNNELKKYITVNQLQNTALKQILELGFIDLIRNKHKKIAKKQIKELDDKKVYELTPKKE
jgi:hypothetical protein